MKLNTIFRSVSRLISNIEDCSMAPFAVVQININRIPSIEALDPKAAKPLLGFLATTAVGCRRGEAERAAGEALRDDEWGLEELEEEDQARVG
jgi:hypothetical protein